MSIDSITYILCRQIMIPSLLSIWFRCSCHESTFRDAGNSGAGPRLYDCIRHCHPAVLMRLPAQHQLINSLSASRPRCWSALGRSITWLSVSSVYELSYTVWAEFLLLLLCSASHCFLSTSPCSRGLMRNTREIPCSSDQNAMALQENNEHVVEAVGLYTRYKTRSRWSQGYFLFLHKIILGALV